MSKNRNALARYQAIDRLLSDGGGHTVKEMMKACQKAQRLEDGDDGTVSRVTIYKDLEAMQDIYKVRIQKSSGRRPVEYSYPAGSNTINGGVISDSDKSVFTDALTFLEGISGFVKMPGTIDKIRKKLQPDMTAISSVMEYEHVPFYKNGEDIWQYYKHIREHHPLQITYEPGFGEPRIYELQPEYLKQYNGRWYLVGWKYATGDNRTEGIRNFALDRIVDDKTKVLRSRLGQIKVTGIDYRQYYSDVIGITVLKDSILHHIVLEFELEGGGQGFYDFNRLKTKSLHHSQQTWEEDRKGYVSLDVRPNPELYTHLRAFPSARIVAPEEVREEHIRILKEMLGRQSPEAE